MLRQLFDVNGFPPSAVGSSRRERRVGRRRLLRAASTRLRITTWARPVSWPPQMSVPSLLTSDGDALGSCLCARFGDR